MSAIEPDLNEPLDALVAHIKANASAAIIQQDGAADDLVAMLQESGWTLEDRVDYVSGKRLRYMVPPPNLAERLAAAPPSGGPSDTQEAT